MGKEVQMISALRLLLTLFTILCCTTIGSAAAQETHAGVVFEKACVLEGKSYFSADFDAPGRGAIVRANVTASQQTRASSGFAEASRRWKASDFYEQAGWSRDRYLNHLDAIDFSKPVKVTTLPVGTRLIQYQIPNASVGNYFAPVGTPGSQLGFYTGGRIPQTFVTRSDVQVLQSTTGSITDTWSLRNVGWNVQTQGGGVQFFTPSPSLFTPIR